MNQKCWMMHRNIPNGSPRAGASQSPPTLYTPRKANHCQHPYPFQDSQKLPNPNMLTSKKSDMFPMHLSLHVKTTWSVFRASSTRSKDNDLSARGWPYQLYSTKSIRSFNRKQSFEMTQKKQSDSSSQQVALHRKADSVSIHHADLPSPPLPPSKKQRIASNTLETI